MPFQYEPFVNPYGASIAELLAHRGDPAAQAAQSAAAAQARAAEVRGQAWGQAAQQIGQIPQQIQQQRDQETTRQLRQAEVTKAQGDQAAGALISKHMTATPDGHLQYDIPGFLQDAQQNPLVASRAPEHADAMQKANDTYQTWKEGRFATKQSAIQGIYAKTAEAGGSPDDYKVISMPFVAAKIISEDDLAPMYQRLSGNPDATARVGLLNAAAGVKPEYKEVGKGGSLVKTMPGAAPETVMTRPDTPSNEAELAVDAQDPKSPTQKQSQAALDAMKKSMAPPSIDEQMNQALKNNDLQSYNRLLKVKHDSREATHITVNTGADAPAPPGDWSVDGEAFLKTIPVQWRKTVEKIAKYEEDPTKVTSMRGGMRERLTQWVNQVNPAYDQSSFAIRNPTRKAFTTGTQGQQLTAMNTAIEHLDMLQQAADSLNNGNFKPGNAVYNYLRDLFGGSPPTTYEAIKEKVDKELDAVASKGVPTVSGAAAQKAIAGISAGPAQIKAYIDANIPLMGSSLNALAYQHQQAMGADFPWKPLTPQAEAVLQKRGITLGGTPPTTSGLPNVGSTFQGGKVLKVEKVR